MSPRLRHAIGDRILDRYEVRAVLGGGAYGTVYHAIDDDGGAHAIKELHIFAEPLAAQQALAYFRREAAHLTHLDHPAIPTAEAVDLEGPFLIDPATGEEAPDGVDDSLVVDRRHYLVMEFVPGRSLEDLIREWNAPPDSETVLSWIRQVGSALSYLHQGNLVHRDVKPDNILIRERDSAALLIDFGLCREATEPGGYETVPISASGRFGTRGYAPPDPVEQENPLPASDLHALAMTARRALTGLDPTQPPELELLREKRLGELRPDLESHVATALDRAIRPSPAERHGSVAAFVAALDAPVAPTASPARTLWIELEPAQLEVGLIAPGELRDLTLVVRDRRPSVRPRGFASSSHENLKILPATARNAEIVLHLLLRVPRNAAPGPVRTRLIVTANDEEHVVPISYRVDPSAPSSSAWQRSGCLTLPLVIFGRK